MRSSINLFASVIAGYKAATIVYKLDDTVTLYSIDADGLQYDYDGTAGTLTIDIPVETSDTSYYITFEYLKGNELLPSQIGIARRNDLPYKNGTCLLNNYTSDYPSSNILYYLSYANTTYKVDDYALQANGEYAKITYSDGVVEVMCDADVSFAGYGKHTFYIDNQTYDFFYCKEYNTWLVKPSSYIGIDKFDAFGTPWIPVYNDTEATLTFSNVDYSTDYTASKTLYNYIINEHEKIITREVCPSSVYYVNKSGSNLNFNINLEYLVDQSCKIYHFYYDTSGNLCSWLIPITAVNRIKIESPTLSLSKAYYEPAYCDPVETINYKGRIDRSTNNVIRFNVTYYISNNADTYNIPVDISTCRAYSMSSYFDNPTLVSYTSTKGIDYTRFNTVWDWNIVPTFNEDITTVRFVIQNTGTYMNSNYAYGRPPYGEAWVDFDLDGAGFSVSFPDELEEETDGRIVITYPTGNQLSFDAPEDVIITIDNETDNGDGTTTAVGTVRVNSENTGSEVSITVSDGTSTITRTITILEKEEPMAAPTISINKYADLAFPQEGGTKYITITYGNSGVAFLNTPYSTEYGVTITPQTTTEIDNGVEIYYAIYVPKTTSQRTIPLIFSCSNAQGTSTTQTFNAMQAGETTDTERAYITLGSYQHAFPAEGGYYDLSLTMGYPGTNEVSIRVANTNGVYPISWCSAEIMGGSTSDDGTEGYRTIRITMNGSDITEPFSARITFSYTNSYGEKATAEFIAIREAADPGAPQSSLSLYRTIMRFDADGKFDYSDPTCTADYRWTNEEDIDEPVIDGDWIVLTEGQHQTGADYIKIPWGVAVARNTSPNSRTGTVTFSSIGQDDIEHSEVLTVIQGGAETSDEVLEYVDLLWKDCEVTLGDDDMTFELLDERYDVFYTGRCQKRPNGESNWFFINKIIQDYVYMEEIPELLDGTSTYQEHENGYREIKLNTPDTVGAMRTFMFKYDWSYQEGSPFILSESIIPYVVKGQRALVTYCNLDYMHPQTDTYSWIKGNGSVENGAISADMEEYATTVLTMPGDAEYYILGGQRYEVITPCAAKYVLYYLSPKGGWCWFPIMGKVNASDRLSTFTLSKNYDNTTAQFGKTRYTVDIATDYELSTGWLTESQSLRMWEMLESNMVYLHDMEKDVIFPVLMKSDTVEKKRHQRGQQKMLSYTFNVETSQGRMRM